MRSPIARTLVFIAILSVFAADISVGCGNQEYVYGPVDQKIGSDAGYMLRIRGDMYSVPAPFYSKVQVGDTVKFDGREWTIVNPDQPSQVTAPPSPARP